MSLENDATQEENLESELETEQEATPVESEEESEAVAADDSESDESEEEWEVVERTPEPSPDAEDKKRNAAFAKQRIEAREAKRKAEALERQLKEIEEGKTPEHLKEQLSAQHDLPAQPNINDFIGDEGLAKYEYDQTRAMAAYQAAMSKWQIDALDARAVGQVKTAEQRQNFIEQERKRIASIRRYEDAVSTMRLEGFDEAEKTLVKTVERVLNIPDASETITNVARQFGDDSKIAVAVVNYLGRNPQEVERLLRMPPEDQTRELYKLGYQDLLPRRKPARQKPEADEALPLGGSSKEPNWKKELSKMLENNDPKFRARKKEWEQKLGRSISSFEL